MYAFKKDGEESKEEAKGGSVEQSGTQKRIFDSLKQEGGLGASKEMREKYRDNPAFNIEQSENAGKRAKTAEAVVFKLPIERPDQDSLRIEPKEYFKFIRAQDKHLSQN